MLAFQSRIKSRSYLSEWRCVALDFCGPATGVMGTGAERYHFDLNRDCLHTQTEGGAN
jgi:hypothetical protein